MTDYLSTVKTPHNKLTAFGEAVPTLSVSIEHIERNRAEIDMKTITHME